MNEELQEKQVVTCFLESEGKILILRRSDRVGSYRGKWAGVSGYLEDTPEKQALTEIREEAGLEEEDINLFKTGEPLIIEDTELATRWIVHPFLFHVRVPGKIRIDWEHREFKWIEPVDIGKFDTVPNLAETLARVIN